jgi:hypothetical protein
MAFIRVIELQTKQEPDLRAVYQANERLARFPTSTEHLTEDRPGIVRAHSLDAELMQRHVWRKHGAYRAHGALSWAEQELIAASASHSNGCFY